MIHPLNWHIVEFDLVIPGIPRVGSTSVVKGFPHIVGAEEAMTYARRLVLIRHPIQRLISAFGHLNQLGYIDMVEGDPFPHERPWEEFLDYILSHEDQHWVPQEPRLYHEGEWMPTELERFEDIKYVWPKYTDKEFPHYNKTEECQPYDLEYREEELNNYYEKDLELWHGLP